jgi:formylglycine-generating enzyme required for sulfatase activity
MGETVVTQELWHAVMKKNPSSIVGAQHPVIDISWDDTQLFIKKLNKITGESFRLPTQAEWEFAACGGYKSKNHKYAGSDNIDEVAWYKDNSTKTIHPVKQKKPNEVGLFDMNGNVWEYCEEHKDNFWETYFTVAGGSYESNERKCRLPATRTFSIVDTATSLRLTLSVKV